MTEDRFNAAVDHYMRVALPKARRYLTMKNADTFSWSEYRRIVLTPEVQRYLRANTTEEERKYASMMRQIITRFDFFMFLNLYLGPLVSQDGNFTPADWHIEIAHEVIQWVDFDKKRPANEVGPRISVTAPRGWGKSSIIFKGLIMWLAAHRHCRIEKRTEMPDAAPFIVVLSNSEDQIAQHVQYITTQLEHNELLRIDFPKLCKTRKTDMTIWTESDFVLLAKTINSGTLNGRTDMYARRPDLIITDDIESATGSEADMENRLEALLHNVLPMNEVARWFNIGTTTMFGGIVHCLLSLIKPCGIEKPDWATDLAISVRHYLPLEVGDDGTWRSTWPSKESAGSQLARQHTQKYQRQMMNNPRAVDGTLWKDEDFVHIRREGRSIEQLREDYRLGSIVLSIDPAITSKKTSDSTGFAVIAYSGNKRKWIVLEALGKKIHINSFGQFCNWLYQEWDIDYIVVETNQGGDVWARELRNAGIPVKIVEIQQSKAGGTKDERAERLYNRFAQRRVLLMEDLGEFEGDMLNYPMGRKDVIDAVGSGITEYAKRFNLKKVQARPGATSRAYV